MSHPIFWSEPIDWFDLILWGGSSQCGRLEEDGGEYR